MEMQGFAYECSHVQWLCRSLEPVMGRTGDPREWFLVNECELSHYSKKDGFNGEVNLT